MDLKEFNKIIKSRICKTENLLIHKGKEYAAEDRLSNFKDGAAFRHKPAEVVLWDYVTKHIVALNTFMETIEKGGEVPSKQWEEKFGDIIVYMMLLETILVENGRVSNAEHS